MSAIPTTHTHTAFSYRRTGKKHGRMLECGSGRIDAERNVAHVVLDRTPLNGFTGYIVLLPHGTKPEPPQQQPQRPGDIEDDDGDE